MRNSLVEEATPLSGVLGNTLPSDLPVTFSKNGSTLSIFSDDIWDYSAISRANRVLDFRRKLDLIKPINTEYKLSDESMNNAVLFLKTLTLHWINAVGGCSMSKLNGDIRAVSYLVRYCLDTNTPFKNILSVPDAIDFLVLRGSTDKQVGLMLGKIQRLLEAASTLLGTVFWSELNRSKAFSERLRRLRRQFPETTDTVQTLLIPSEIYQGILRNTLENLDLFIQHEDSIKTLFRSREIARDMVVRGPLPELPAYLSRRQQRLLKYYWDKEVGEKWQVSLALKELAESGISKSENWGGLASNLHRWQMRCAILISAFTGMRVSELKAIPLNGLRYISTESGEIPVVWSTTSKLEPNGVPRFTKWVTGDVVEKAFNVCRIIAEGVLAWSMDRKIVDVNQDDIPLFISAENAIKGKPHPHFSYTTNALSSKNVNSSICAKELEISSFDLDEISWFLYGEDIPKDLRVGGSWPLQFHQFRRSMAVYAAASGMVSYPVLKAQLKHMSMVMTVYYSDSNSRAKNLLGDDTSALAMRAEWDEAKAHFESDEIHQLLESNLPLTGSAGKKLKILQARNQLPTFFESRQATKLAVKKGKIRYRTTMVGGCMSLKPCNKGAGVLASACVSCENAVFLPGSRVALEQTKEFYQVELAKGGPLRARLEYQENIRNIEVFLQNLVEIQDTYNESQ